jgi:hypothetical protein
MKIYLSGSVKEEVYRGYVLYKYSGDFDIFDPLTEVEKRLGLDVKGYREGRVEFDNNVVSDIVEGDIKLIDKCDILVAKMNIYSAGTIMEIRIAYDLDMPVYIIDVSGKMRKDIWLRYHTNVFFDNIDTCFDFLKSLK